MAKKKAPKGEIKVTSEGPVTLVTQDFMTGEVTQRPLDRPLEKLPHGSVAGDGYAHKLLDRLWRVSEGQRPFSDLSAQDLEYATASFSFKGYLVNALHRNGRRPADMLDFAYPDGRVPDASWRVATCCMLLDKLCDLAQAPQEVEEAFGQRAKVAEALSRAFPETLATTPLAYYAWLCASDHENAVMKAAQGTVGPAELALAGRKAKAEARARQVRLLKATLVA